MRKGTQLPHLGWQLGFHWGYGFRVWGIQALSLSLGIAGLCVSCQSLKTQNKSLSQPTTVKLSGWGASPVEKKLLLSVIRDFEATHPHIRVQFEIIADQYMDVLKTRLVGDAGPDAFYLDAVEAPFLMQAHVLEPLNAYIQPDFDLADFEPTLLRAFQINSTLYGLPKDYSTLALFYNREALQKVGLKAAPTTWPQLQAAAQRLTLDRNQDGKPEQYGFGFTPDLARLVYGLQAYGGQAIDDRGRAAFASKSAQRGLQAWVDLYRRSRTAVLPADVGSSSGSDMLGQQKTAMVIEGNWAIPYLQETFPALKFGTAKVPTLNGRAGTMAFTVAYAMNRASRHKPETWQLIAYLTGKTGMYRWTSSGFALPTRRSVARRLNYERDPLRSPLIAGVAYATPWQLGRYPTPIMTSFNNQFLSALLGEQPLSLALERAQTDANRQIEAAQ